MAGLYVHIPFCRSKCAYCDFYSGPLRGFEPEAYADALMRELRARRREVGELQTVYIGGGTPSTMPPALLAPLLALAPGERTVEVNPDDITPAYADALMRAGANRVSMGIQSLDDAELRAVGRRHTAAAAVAAYRTLRAAGFANISLDLIYGLPGQTPDGWRRTLEATLDLGPDHLSAYLLSYEPGTRLDAMRRAGKVAEVSDDAAEQMYATLCELTRAAGMTHYEISNFAMPGREARHNAAYWDGTPYLGLGPGAHSFDGTLRRYNPSDLKAYMAAPERAATVDEETPANRFNDTVMTALRTARGLDPAILTPAELATARRLLEPTPDGRLRIAESAWLRSDPIIISLLRV